MTKTWAVAVASFNTKTLVPQICFPNECWSTNSFFDGWAQGQWRFRWWRPRLAILDKRWNQEIAREKTLKNLLYPLWSHCRAKLGFAKFIHWIVHKYVIYEDCMFSHLILSQVSGRLHYYKTNPQRQRTKHRSDMLGIAPTNITNALFTFTRQAPFRFNGCRVNTEESKSPFVQVTTWYQTICHNGACEIGRFSRPTVIVPWLPKSEGKELIASQHHR